MNIYFAGSIRGGREDKELYLQIIEHLKCHGRVLTEHIGAQSLLSSGEIRLSDREIYERDMAWIAEADIVVAEVTSPSLGVGYELGWASGKKPVLCLYRPRPDRRLSAMIEGDTRLTICHYQTLEEARGLIDQYLHERGYTTG